MSKETKYLAIYQAYKTRVATKAMQADENLKKTIPVLENKIAMELAGIP